MGAINTETLTFKENVKQTKIDRVIDYLKEEAYLSDIDLKEDDCYYTFFEKLYDYFEYKKISDFYMPVMFDFASKCILEQKRIDVKQLINNLDKLEKTNLSIPENKRLQKEDIQNLKSMIEIPKTKVLV